MKTPFLKKQIVKLTKAFRPEYLILISVSLLFVTIIWLIHEQSWWALLPISIIIIIQYLVKYER
jgi:hypothetical protein